MEVSATSQLTVPRTIIIDGLSLLYQWKSFGNMTENQQFTLIPKFSLQIRPKKYCIALQLKRKKWERDDNTVHMMEK